MDDSRIPTIDHLSERGVIDRWGFFAFAVFGITGIIIAKALGTRAWLVAAAAAIVMCAYAALVQTAGTGRLRSDQAGDNCYYLGLIYTLASLAYAIFFFDPANTATTVVQGFGIALATTIMGLVLRVFFSQSRVDLHDTEDDARIALAEAAGRLKGELSQATVAIGDFAHQTQQMLVELRDQIATDLSVVQKAALESITATSAAATELLKTQTAELNNRYKRLAAGTEQIVEQMTRHGEALMAIAANGEGLAGQIGSFRDGARELSSIAAALNEQSRLLAEQQQSVSSSGRAAAQAAEVIESRMQSLNEAIASFEQKMAGRLAEVIAAPAQSLQPSMDAIHAAAARLEAGTDAFVAAQESAARKVAEHVSATIAAAANHDEALAADLVRSRSNVGKVHAALVEMTGELAEQVGGRAA
jgi:hypothetical protein